MGDLGVAELGVQRQAEDLPRQALGARQRDRAVAELAVGLLDGGSGAVVDQRADAARRQRRGEASRSRARTT